MASLKTIQKILNKKESYRNTTSDFLKLHYSVESYLRRLFLIMLRLNGLKYDFAKANVNKIKFNIKNINKLLLNLNIAHSINDLNNKNYNFEVLNNLYVNFSSKYRNIIVHGNREEINDSLCKLLIHIDISFIREFDNIIKAKFNFSPVFSNPKKFGAKKVTNGNMDEIFKDLSFDEYKNDKPYNIDRAIGLLKNTKYSYITV